LAVGFVTSHSLLYELIEWGAAVVFGGDLRMAFLGTQGDVWDTQSDMFMALIGATAAIALLARWHDRQLAKFKPL
jgi:putative membrane protein